MPAGPIPASGPWSHARPAGNTEQGLCDMAGGLWEWTDDVFRDSYEGAPADGGAWKGPRGSYHVIRGGGFGAGWRMQRTTTRSYANPDPRVLNEHLGVRPVRPVR